MALQFLTAHTAGFPSTVLRANFFIPQAEGERGQVNSLIHGSLPGFITGAGW